jgi:glucosamine-6-phosphate deaminase
VRIVILPDAADVACFAAQELASIVRGKPDAVLGLATGSTPLGTYRHLMEVHQVEKLSFRRVQTFNLDEYLGLSSSHPASYRHFMNEHLFRFLDIPLEQTCVPRGDALDVEEECQAYERRIGEAGGIDCQLLGIGSDGHIGFNEPGSSLASRTRVKTLTERTRLDNARFFASLDEVPTAAITMGIGTILEARQVLLLATGQGKAEAIREAVEGPVSSSLPASALQLHPSATIVVDEGAACRLQRADYYRLAEQQRQRLRKEA